MLPRSSSVGQAKATIGQHFSKEVTIDRYVVNQGRLETILISDQDSLA